MADLNVNGKLVAPRIVLDTQDGNYNEGVRINAKDDAWAVTIYGTPLDTDINGNYDNSMIVGRPANGSDLIISGTKNNLDDTKRVRITQTGEIYEKAERVYSPNNIPTSLSYTDTFGGRRVTATQISGDYQGSTGRTDLWASYLIFNHDPSYWQMIRMPFFDNDNYGIPSYQRLMDGQLRGWKSFVTEDGRGSNYIRFENGIMIYFERFTITGNDMIIDKSFPEPFIEEPVITVTKVHHDGWSSMYAPQSWPTAVAQADSTRFRMKCSDSNNRMSMSVIAVGYWR